MECEPFLKSNSHDILILCETSLDDSIDSGNFSMTDYLPIVQNNSITHICIALQLKRRKDFLLHRLISGKLYRFLLMFLAAFTKLIVLRLCPLSTTLFNFMYGVLFYFLQASWYKKTDMWCFARLNIIIYFLVMWPWKTFLNLFRCVMLCDVWYTFLCPYKLCNNCLLRCISLTWFCFKEYQSFLWNSGLTQLDCFCET